MSSPTRDVETLVSPPQDGPSIITLTIATVCLIWYIIVAVVCIIGYCQLWRYFSKARTQAHWSEDNAPHITIIRPVKGLEPSLYDCLSSTFQQHYPQSKLHVRFCVSNRHDPAFPVLNRLIKDFQHFDVQILLEDEDALLQDDTQAFGPNPKIRNMSRAYREAVGDVVWIMDCNVWVAKGVCGRMVAKLDGVGEKQRNKFVHHLPLVIDTPGTTTSEELHGHLGSEDGNQIRTTSTASHDLLPVKHQTRNASSIGGGRLEEVFMSSAHAKFYTAINTVLFAPCIVGKSTMFRRSHLNSLTDSSGIDFFSENICEDHLIGDMLWKQQVPEERQGEKLGKHAMCFGDFAVQPMANMSVAEYWQRRVRWLRVRKFTVTLATLVEPGTESFLCSLYGAFAFTTLPFFHDALNIPRTWSAFAALWLLSVSIWCAMDRTLYLLLHSAASIEIDEDTPPFARPPEAKRRRGLGEWIFAWLGRETLAFPIWFWAFYGGTRVEWRGRKFWVGLDMKVHEIADEAPLLQSTRSDGGSSRHSSRGRKDRSD